MNGVNSTMSKREIKETIIRDMFYYDPIKGDVYRDPTSQYAKIPKYVLNSDNPDETKWARTPVFNKRAEWGGRAREMVVRLNTHADLEKRTLYLNKAKVVVALNTGIWPQGHLTFKDGDARNSRFENIEYKLPQGTRIRHTKMKVRLSPATNEESIEALPKMIEELEKKSIPKLPKVDSSEERIEKHAHIEIPITRKPKPSKETPPDNAANDQSFAGTVISIIKKYVKF